MHTLGIDIETYCDLNLLDCGVHKYAAHKSFEILLFAYSIDHGPVHIIDLACGDKMPPSLIKLLVHPDVIKTAHNAMFEMVCLSSWFCLELDPIQWICTMVKSSMLGYPQGLDKVAEAMGLPLKKDKNGRALVKYFSNPCKPTPANGMRTRNLPHHHPEAWEGFRYYNIQDVKVEQAITKNIEFFKIPSMERKLWVLDQKINNIGVMVDLKLINNAISFNDIHSDLLTKEAKELTGVENPNSPKQLKDWLSVITESQVDSLTKESVLNIMAWNDDPVVHRVLEIRQEMAKTSVKKYQAMIDSVGDDNRIRGLLQIYGANKTGRWAGRIVQIQNLTKPEFIHLDLARQSLLSGDLAYFEMVCGNISRALSGLIRTAFISPPGKMLAVSDFSAIEARVIAWFAGEMWRLKIFKGHGKIYEASGAEMFKVPIEQITKGSDLRAKSKVSELALGFQGSYGAMIRMGALKMGIKDEEIMPLVNLWRATNPHIVRLWGEVNNAAIQAVDQGAGTVKLRLWIGGPTLEFFMKHQTLFIKLPSGRCLAYVKPVLKVNKYNQMGIEYMGVDQDTKRWTKQETYGGKLVENIVQGTARDILADSMLRLDAAGYSILMHVHDEVIIEIPDVKPEEELIKINEIMGQEISWAKNLPLNAEGFVTPYYLKD